MLGVAQFIKHFKDIIQILKLFLLNFEKTEKHPCFCVLRKLENGEQVP